MPVSKFSRAAVWPRRAASYAYHLALGWKRLQPAYELLHLVALEGMHMGATADDVGASGERAVLRSLRREIGSLAPLVVFDVGANVGNYTAAALELIAPQVHVWCFEPAVAAFARLERRFGNCSDVTLLPVALGQNEETVPLYSDAPTSGVASVLPRELGHRGLLMEAREMVIVQRLDTVCRAHGVTHIHLLKLDVEGNEMDVLRGAETMIGSGNVDAIQFEFGEGHLTARTFLHDFYALLEPRYRISRIVRNGLVPVDCYKSSHEVFTTTNYLAVARRLQVIKQDHRQ